MKYAKRAREPGCRSWTGHASPITPSHNTATSDEIETPLARPRRPHAMELCTRAIREGRAGLHVSTFNAGPRVMVVSSATEKQMRGD